MEDTVNVSSQEQLAQLRQEGKITEAEYHDLLTAMQASPTSQPQANPPVESADHNPASRPSIPHVLWVGLACLAFMIVSKIITAFTAGPAVLVDAATSAALLWGLYSGQKWAYILTYVFVALGIVVAGQQGIEAAFMILLFDSLVLVPVILSHNYFFPKTAQT